MYKLTIKELMETGYDVTTSFNGGLRLTNSKTSKYPIEFYINPSFSIVSTTLNGESILSDQELFYEGDLLKLIEHISNDYPRIIEENCFKSKQSKAKREFLNSYFLKSLESRILQGNETEKTFDHSRWSVTHPTCKVYKTLDDWGDPISYPKIVLDIATSELAIFRTAKEEVFEGKILDLHFLNRVFESVDI